jgi:hypothetical protein
MTISEETLAAVDGQGVNTRAKSKEPPPYRYRWWNAIRKARKITTTDVAVALMLSTHANGDGGNAHPGIALLAAECKCSERTVRRSLRRLADLGYVVDVSSVPLSRRAAMGYCTVYKLAIPRSSAPDSDDIAPDNHDTEHRTPMAALQFREQINKEHSDPVSGAACRAPVASDASERPADDWRTYRRNSDGDVWEDAEDRLWAVLDPDDAEMSTISGMLDKGCHPKMVLNKINADRRKERQLVPSVGPCPHQCTGGFLMTAGDTMEYCPTCRPE